MTEVIIILIICVLSGIHVWTVGMGWKCSHFGYMPNWRVTHAHCCLLQVHTIWNVFRFTDYATKVSNTYTTTHIAHVFPHWCPLNNWANISRRNGRTGQILETLWNRMAGLLKRKFIVPYELLKTIFNHHIASEELFNVRGRQWEYHPSTNQVEHEDWIFQEAS